MMSVELALVDLIYPHRMDIVLRVQALQALDSGGRRALLATPYTRFMRAVAPERTIDQFIELYDSVLKDAWAGNELSVYDLGNPHDSWLHPTREHVSLSVPFRYSLAGGAHRLAVLIHLGKERWVFNVEPWSGQKVPDFTTYIAREPFPADVDAFRRQ